MNQQLCVWLTQSYKSGRAFGVGFEYNIDKMLCLIRAWYTYIHCVLDI